ncbi:MAG: hypothetical protein JNJ70_22605 [Verrucomicrobiales bacterium]|nr:hypothetical protein [Verrucomicrobiales bacterium]
MKDADGWLLVHAAATWALVGLIWVVQLVVYPAFAMVGKEGFGDYHAAHSRNITWVVGPLMLAELATALVLLATGTGGGVFGASLALLALIWVSTGLVQVPLHQRLSSGKDEKVIRSLVRTNWIRTVAWTLRGVAVAVMLAAARDFAQ